MAKRTVTTKEKATKDSDARKKVDELLDEIIPSKEKKTPKVTPKSVEKAKNVGWLEKEVERLIKVNEELESKFAEANNNYQKAFAELTQLKESGGATTDNEIRLKVIEHFKDLEDAFLGRNAQRVRYQNTTVQAQLDKMVTRFPFLKELVTRR